MGATGDKPYILGVNEGEMELGVPFDQLTFTIQSNAHTVYPQRVRGRENSIRLLNVSLSLLERNNHLEP